jgi:hypothetical protein
MPYGHHRRTVAVGDSKSAIGGSATITAGGASQSHNGGDAFLAGGDSLNKGIATGGSVAISAGTSHTTGALGGSVLVKIPVALLLSTSGGQSDVWVRVYQAAAEAAAALPLLPAASMAVVVSLPVPFLSLLVPPSQQPAVPLTLELASKAASGSGGAVTYR